MTIGRFDHPFIYRTLVLFVLIIGLAQAPATFAQGIFDWMSSEQWQEIKAQQFSTNLWQNWLPKQQDNVQGRQWHERIGLLKGLLKQYKLIGSTRKEIVASLGEPPKAPVSLPSGSCDVYPLTGYSGVLMCGVGSRSKIGPSVFFSYDTHMRLSEINVQFDQRRQYGSVRPFFRRSSKGDVGLL